MRGCARCRAGGARSSVPSCSSCSAAVGRCASGPVWTCRSRGSLPSVDDAFEAELSLRGDELWVLPVGDLDLAAAPELEETLSLAMASDAPAVVIDLRGLEFVDS